MSNTDFPMPKTVEMPRTNATTPPPSDYAPRRGLEAVEEAVGRAALAQAVQMRPTLPPSDYKTPKASDAIKDKLKQLTHREMRQLVNEIFDAYAKFDSPLETGQMRAISVSMLPDVLDKFAYGD